MAAPTNSSGRPKRCSGMPARQLDGARLREEGGPYEATRVECLEVSLTSRKSYCLARA